MNAIYKFFFAALPASYSGFGKINWLDVNKSLRLAATAAIGYFIGEAVTSLMSVDFGSLKPIVDIVLMGLAELGRRLLADKPKP